MNIKEKIKEIKKGSKNPALWDVQLINLALRCETYKEVKLVTNQLTDKTIREWLLDLPKIRKLKKK